MLSKIIFPNNRIALNHVFVCGDGATPPHPSSRQPRKFACEENLEFTAGARR